MAVVADPGSGNIKVVVRVRPFNNRERARKAKCVVCMEQDQTIVTSEEPPAASTPTKSKGDRTRVFKFDKSYWSFDTTGGEYAGQEQVFTDLGQPLLDNAFQGFNNCIFAYGQTGSGKSYSMMGSRDDPGVIPRICEALFSRINELSTENGTQFTVEVSYLEIYNERVRDLLNPKNRGNLRVREHPSLGPYVEDLSRLVVSSFAEIEELMDEGNKARTVAATNMNETSSRSHAVFTLTLTQHFNDAVTGLSSEKVSRMSLVDLAGSERASATGASGSRLKEGTEINRSLSALGRVIRTLADVSSGKKQRDLVVPYRDSALTWLLKDSLGGNSMTAMIATISPADINYEETVSTLRYADSAKRIKNHAVVNEDPNARLIRELKEELLILRTKLGSGEDRGSSDSQEAGDDSSDRMVTITAPDGTVRKVSRAEIAEQLNASEKLLKEMNQTWEERLEMTKKIQKQREAALEEMGINVEKGFIGLHTPRNVPFLVNLSDDPLLAECLVYNIKQGSTSVGNADSSTTAQIRLRGSKILTDHCTFENDNNIVTIIPHANASVMVNGLRLRETARRLHSGDRVILGDFHIFRFSNPQEALQERKSGFAVSGPIRGLQGSLQRTRSSTTTGSGPGVHSSSSASDHSERASSVASDYVDFPSFDDASISRAQTPVTSEDQNGGTNDWSMARMEAARTYLGGDSATVNVGAMTDEELDKLFEEMQRVRSIRKGRSDSMSEAYDGDTDSLFSFGSPTTSSQSKLRSMQSASETAEDPFVSPSPTSGIVNAAVPESSLFAKLSQGHASDARGRPTSAQRSDSGSKKPQRPETASTKSPPEKTETTKDVRSASRESSTTSTYQSIHSQFLPQSSFMLRRNPVLSDDEKKVAKKTINRWMRRGSLRMADSIYRHALLLKEAQIMSNELDQGLRFQYMVVDEGFVSTSPYDLVLNDAEPEEDSFISKALKPCIGVRVTDFRNETIKVFSIEKLESRVRAMRNIYNESPMYSELQSSPKAKKFPFSDTFNCKYSYVGEAYASMAGVIHGKVSEISAEIISPYTLSVIGIISLELRPPEEKSEDQSHDLAVIAHLRSIAGFSEREFTDVHVQMLLPGSSYPYSSNSGGISTSPVVSGFGEDGPVVIDSQHRITVSSLLADSSISHGGVNSSLLRLKVFAKVTSTHLEKLESWDDMQESEVDVNSKLREGASIHSESFADDSSMVQQHDSFVKIQMLELSDDGCYEPVDILRGYHEEKGVLYLHIGVQKQIRLSITHSSGDTFDWSDLSKLSVSNIRLFDSQTETLSESESKVDKVELRVTNKPKTIANADGTRTVTVVGQWDCSAHSSPFLDRTTPDKHRIVMSVNWTVSTPSVTSPVEFTTNLVGVMLGRAARGPSRFSLMWASTKLMRSYVALFQVRLRPYNNIGSEISSARSTYISGEEYLGLWKPRGLSLVGQYIRAIDQRQRAVELGHTVSTLSYIKFKKYDASAHSAQSQEVTDSSEDLAQEVAQVFTSHETEVIQRSLKLWKRKPGYVDEQSGVSTLPVSSMSKPSATKYVADVRQFQRSVNVVKDGYAYAPDDAMQSWVRRYLELRRPYLHIYNASDMEEIFAINITQCKISCKPDLTPELESRNPYNEENTFVVFSENGMHLFSVKSHSEMSEWVLKLSQSFGSEVQSVIE
ncbi:kinesin family protein [Myxozyma melibiosi]|uniref:Kinesin family protein n=1 Tax=Myxozyma melibiosi TaxID=54550 RepID=A0ABR1FDZ7_9ASCO